VKIIDLSPGLMIELTVLLNDESSTLLHIAFADVLQPYEVLISMLRKIGGNEIGRVRRKSF